jgi:hypothetical protein
VPERDRTEIVGRIRRAFERDDVDLSIHARQEMAAEGISVEELADAIATAELLEDDPDHRRGPCCLLVGTTRTGRYVHVVCTTDLPGVVVITMYEPKPPRWPTPRERRRAE